MEILRSRDIEDVIRTALDTYIDTYCRPLPKDFVMPCILISQVGGTEKDTIGSYDVVLDSRALTDAKANETLRNAIGILRKIAQDQSTPISFVNVNSSGSWGNDPVRPGVKLCSARLNVIAHLEKATITTTNI